MLFSNRVALKFLKISSPKILQKSSRFKLSFIHPLRFHLKPYLSAVIIANFVPKLHGIFTRTIGDKFTVLRIVR